MREDSYIERFVNAVNKQLIDEVKMDSQPEVQKFVCL
jgi:hypothetical protein